MTNPTPAEKAAAAVCAHMDCDDDFREHVCAVIQSAIDESLPKWEPIESAPRQGRVLVWTGKNIFTASLDKGHSTDEEAWVVPSGYASEAYDDKIRVRATHWMPLPQPPEDAR